MDIWVDGRFEVELKHSVERGCILRTKRLDQAVEEEGDGIGLCVRPKHCVRSTERNWRLANSSFVHVKESQLGSARRRARG